MKSNKFPRLVVSASDEDGIIRLILPKPRTGLFVSVKVIASDPPRYDVRVLEVKRTGRKIPRLKAKKK